MDEKKLTPVTISTTSFADKAQEYAKISDEISDTEAEIAEAEFGLKTWLNEQGFSDLAESGNLTDLWKKLVVMKPPVEPEEDEEKTAALRKEYATHVKKVVNSKIALQTKRNKLTDVKNYIGFLKDIVTLAPRPQGKDQKGSQPQGGGQQKQG